MSSPASERHDLKVGDAVEVVDWLDEMDTRYLGARGVVISIEPCMVYPIVVRFPDGDIQRFKRKQLAMAAPKE